MSTWIIINTVELTGSTITIPVNGRFDAYQIWTNEIWTNEYSICTSGTKLLRDFAQASNDYLEKKEISQQGWKSRYELRNA